MTAASPRWLRVSEGRSAVVLALYTLVSRLPLLTYPKACDDEQVYAVVAMEMLRGGRPYVDAIERKPPLLFYLYEALLRLGGPYNYFPLHLAALLWTLATMALLYAIARRMFDASTGLVAALIYAIFSSWADYTNLAFNGELLMNLPVVAALALALRPSRSKARVELIASGACVALAFLLKQPSAIAGIPLALYVLHPDYRATRGLSWRASILHPALLAIGFVLVLLVAAGLLDRAGILAEAWYWTVGNHANPLGPTTWFFWHKLPATGAFFVAETLPLLLVTALSLRDGFRGSGTWQTRRAEFVLFVTLLGGSLLGVSANGQFLYHYFIQLIPPLALLASPVFVDIWKGTRRSMARFLQPIFLAWWVGLTALLFLTIDTIGLARPHVRVPLKTAVYVREHSTEDDRLFMWGQGTAQTGLYLDSERRPATRYIASFPLNGIIFGLLDANYDTSFHIVPGSWKHLREDFAQHPPKFIIDCHVVRDGPFYKIRDYPYLRDLLAAQYREVFRAEDGVVYGRQPDEPSVERGASPSVR